MLTITDNLLLSTNATQKNSSK